MIRGTAPVEVPAGDETAAARHVRQMFGRVAPRYDLLNHLLSFQVDRYWRRFAVEKVRRTLDRPGARALDLCCGTGDLLLALRRVSAGPLYGSDFSRPMLSAARAKLGAHALARLRSIATTSSPHIHEVRGRGLWIGVELKPEAGGARRFCEMLAAEGVLCKETHTHVIRVSPPLVISEPELDWALDRFETVLARP